MTKRIKLIARPVLACHSKKSLGQASDFTGKPGVIGLSARSLGHATRVRSVQDLMTPLDDIPAAPNRKDH